LRILKTSAATLKKTWGESLLGYLGLQFGGLLMILGSVVVFVAAVALSIALATAWIIAITAVVWFLGVIAFSYLLSVAGQVYRGALYLYAAEGTAPGPFDAEQMNAAWKMKAGRKPAG
jgi:fatty acid desaturase